MMNKKAAGFALIMTAAVFLLCGWAIYKFMTAKTGVADMFNSPAKILELDQEKEKFEFYARESAELAVAEAHQEIADAGRFAGQECVIESGYQHFCSLDSKIDEKFSSAIEEKMNKFILSYPNTKLDAEPNLEFSKITYKVSTQDKIINFNSEKKQLKGSAEGFFAYSFTYDFLPSFSLSLDDLNLNTFQEIFAKVNECNNTEEIIICINEQCHKEKDITKCMNELQNFNTAIKKSDDKTYFDLKSKKGFFIGNSYKNIVLKFSY
jgi:hypothetical protein